MQKKKSISVIIKSTFLLVSLMFSITSAHAQASVAPPAKDAFPPLLSDSNFYLIICAVALLLLLIVVLGKTSVSLSRAVAKMNKKSSATILLLLVSAGAFAQTNADAPKAVAYFPEWADNPTVYVLGFLFSIMLFALYALYRTNMSLLKYISPEETEVVTAEAKAIAETKPHFIRRMYAKLAGGVPIAEEKDILLDHDYDGIKELDNKLPPWWKYGFYFTIIFAIVYLFIYQISGIGKLSHEEYQAELQQAEQQKEARMKANLDNVNESNVVALADADALAKGKETFIKFCSPCHRPDAGGQVGPNLTDEYWLHGGGIKNVFRTITYGVPAKGMISWKAQLSAKQIQQVGSYVLSLKGSNPPSPKEPQGDVWVEEATPQTDSLKTTSHASAAILLTH
jgi:cytochrome c oxidase cbb3-type subunit 3